MAIHEITNETRRVSKIGHTCNSPSPRAKPHHIQKITVFQMENVNYLRGVGVRIRVDGSKDDAVINLTGSAAVELVKGIIMNVDDITFAVDEELRKLITEKYKRQDEESQAIVDCIRRDVRYHIGNVDRVGNQKEATEQVSKQLGEFYREWGQKLKVVVDRSKTGEERLAALNWIEKNIGEKVTPMEDLETMTDDLLKEIDPDAMAKELATELPSGAGCSCPAAECPTHGTLDQNELKHGRRVRNLPSVSPAVGPTADALISKRASEEV